MPPKAKKVPAPIDRPLSRAYLREFTGWSTAYPPGISDPTSLRIMENVMVNRDSSVRVRPGLRYISFEEVSTVLGGIRNKVVGSHEPFFLDNGSKAYLFAVREDDGTVGFRVLARSPVGQVVKKLTDDPVNFSIRGSESNLRFSSGTTYVKYLQIDNKVYALSNNGEMMRQFLVGKPKVARRLTSISRPNFDITDKLAVVHPKLSWVDGGRPTSTETNYIAAPNMSNIAAWNTLGGLTTLTRSTTIAYQGLYSARLASKPERTNLMPNPLDNPGSSLWGWTDGGSASRLDASGGAARINVNAGHKDELVWAKGPKMPVDEKTWYRCAFDLESRNDVDSIQVRFVFYTTGNKAIGEPQNVNCSENAPDRKYPADVRAPAGADTVQVYIGGRALNNTSGNMRFKNVVVCLKDEAAGMFHGGSGTNYFWTGTAGRSASVYHPPQTVQAFIEIPGLQTKDYVTSSYFRAETVARSCSLDIEWRKSDDTVISSKVGVTVNDSSSSWTRNQTTEKGPALTDKARVKIKIAGVPRGEYHYFDAAMLELGTNPGTYYDGDSPNTPTLKYRWLGDNDNSRSVKETYPAVSVLPPAETKTTSTLISSDSTKNKFTFGFFYTFVNEVGESAASQVSIIKMQRAWSLWDWKDSAGNDTQDGNLSVDQLAVFMPQPVHEAAISSGAEYWNLYGFTWSDQEPVPVNAVLIARRKLNSDHSETGWMRVTADMASAAKGMAPIPSEATRFNYSDPSKGGQGIVAADRMVLVYDPSQGNEARIRWTSNEQGNYTDFSASRGGGYKTLTSGNLYIPACVVLWQNPQSVDTLTIMCLGTDGRSSGYYMAPADISSQTEATKIMGFEETTATPGTTSPYGCEVMNNALYHPLDDQLMKSTANNYNINHKPQTDQIADVWRALLSKQYVVSSQLNNRIYYLVNNPDGEPLKSDCRGNEVWVLDAQAETPTWSRFLTQGCSLRKIEQGAKIFMSLVRPEGIFYFDEDYDRDDVVNADYTISQQFIPWKLETNTQGANRAHDAWAHLQQVNIVTGYYQGNMRFGVRGWDMNGKPVDVSKTFRDMNEASQLAFDLEGYLLVRRDMKEWFFYAESLTDEAGLTEHSFGQINLVQYRYAPVSVNLGYEFGSVETFEYQRSFQPLENRTTTNGVPIPYVDTRRP